VSLADALEAAASALPALEEAIRPANGDPGRVLAELDAASAVTVLRWLLDQRSDAADELALAWSEEEAGRAALAAIEETSLAKPGKKALRRVLHRLRSRGVEIATAVPPAPHVATLPKLDDAFDVALVSSPDPSGAQLVVPVEAATGGGARIFQGAVDVARGIHELRAVIATRSQARRLVRDLTASPRLDAVSVPRDALAALLSRAAEAQPAERVLPAAFTEWRSRIARPAADTPTPGDTARAALATDPTPALLRDVAEAVSRGEVGAWPPPFEALRPVAEKVRETAKSALLVDDAQRRAQVDGVLDEAVEQLFVGDHAAAVALRFEEAAHARWRRGDEDAARRWVAAATAFRAGAPRDNPVARALLDRIVEPLVQALDQMDAARAAQAEG
jgi:hypothetical protein